MRGELVPSLSAAVGQDPQTKPKAEDMTNGGAPIVVEHKSRSKLCVRDDANTGACAEHDTSENEYACALNDTLMHSSAHQRRCTSSEVSPDLARSQRGRPAAGIGVSPSVTR